MNETGQKQSFDDAIILLRELKGRGLELQLIAKAKETVDSFNQRNAQNPTKLEAVAELWDIIQKQHRSSYVENVIGELLAVTTSPGFRMTTFGY